MIHRLATRLRRTLVGCEVTAATPGRRRPDGLPASALDGRTLESVESRGKHLVLHFSGGLALHSHLGMRGSWDVHERGGRWRKATPRAWIAIAGCDHEAVNFDGSSLRLVRRAELRRDPRLASLGPDILGDDFDAELVAARLAAAGHLQLGEALLDQGLVAGIGNIFKSEGCHQAGRSPWTPVSELEPAGLIAVLKATRALMLSSAESGRQPQSVYGRAGRPCPRCGERLRSRAQGDSARLTYWCPRCQARETAAEAARATGNPADA